MQTGEWQLRIWGWFSQTENVVLWHNISFHLEYFVLFFWGIFGWTYLVHLVFHLCRMSPSCTSLIPSSYWIWWQSWRSRTCPCFTSPQGWRRHWRSSDSPWRQPRRICKHHGDKGSSLCEWMILVFCLCFKMSKHSCTLQVPHLKFILSICSSSLAWFLSFVSTSTWHHCSMAKKDKPHYWLKLV